MRTGDADDRHRRPARANRLGDHPPRILPDQPRRLRRRDLRRSRSSEIIRDRPRLPEIGPDYPRSAEIGRGLTVPPHAPDLAVGRPFSPRFRLHSKWTSLCGFILAFMARGRPSVAVVAPAAAVVVMRTVPFHVAGDGHRARRDAVRVRSCARRARRAPRVAGAALLLLSPRPLTYGLFPRVAATCTARPPPLRPAAVTAAIDRAQRLAHLDAHNALRRLPVVVASTKRSFTRGMQSQCWRVRHHHASSW